jgi:hypothetical protein
MRAVLLISLLAAAAVGLSVPAGASAGCGGVRTEAAKRKPRRGKPPLAIGDSTMLLALDDLARIGYDANAHGCRQMAEGLAVIRHRKAVGDLPHLVVLALGTDWKVSRSDIRRALHMLGPNRVLGLVTPRELGGWSGSDATHMRQAASVYRRHVKLLDWVKYSRGHGSWFQPDGTHLTFSGAHAFARLFRKALPFAVGPPFH